ncbi:hypothetical protein KFL_012930010, partial [Klebsormidium nitens]
NAKIPQAFNTAGAQHSSKAAVAKHHLEARRSRLAIVQVFLGLTLLADDGMHKWWEMKLNGHAAPSEGGEEVEDAVLVKGPAI